MAMENPPFWWFLLGKMVIFMGYVSFREGKGFAMSGESQIAISIVIDWLGCFFWWWSHQLTRGRRHPWHVGVWFKNLISLPKKQLPELHTAGGLPWALCASCLILWLVLKGEGLMHRGHVLPVLFYLIGWKIGIGSARNTLPETNIAPENRPPQ